MDADFIAHSTSNGSILPHRESQKHFVAFLQHFFWGVHSTYSREVIRTLTNERLSPGKHALRLAMPAQERGFLVYVPHNMPVGDWPVVLAFHGNGSNPEGLIEFTGLAAKADRAGFLAVFPAGSGRLDRARSFNAGNCCGYALRHQIDDVGFLAALLDHLPELAPIDPRRVYATGMSNGALMCYLAADRLADRIAAIAPVAGPMGTETCSPSRPVPVCHFHGTADEFASYRGGRGRRSITGTDFYSVEHTIGRWVAANRCHPVPEQVELEPQVEDGTRVTRTTYRGPQPHSEVVLYTIHGGGHTWPDGPGQMKFLGPTTRNLSANEVMWEFFERHRLEE